MDGCSLRYWMPFARMRVSSAALPPSACGPSSSIAMIVVGIGGVSCSGKTTAAEGLLLACTPHAAATRGRSAGGDDDSVLCGPTVVSVDAFYRTDVPPPRHPGLGCDDWDAPETIDWPALDAAVLAASSAAVSGDGDPADEDEEEEDEEHSPSSSDASSKGKKPAVVVVEGALLPHLPRLADRVHVLLWLVVGGGGGGGGRPAPPPRGAP